jgi:hypothetical protein
MSLGAVKSPLSRMLCSARLIIVFTGGGNDGGIDECPSLDRYRL